MKYTNQIHTFAVFAPSFFFFASSNVASAFFLDSLVTASRSLHSMSLVLENVTQGGGYLPPYVTPYFHVNAYHVCYNLHAFQVLKSYFSLASFIGKIRRKLTEINKSVQPNCSKSHKNAPLYTVPVICGLVRTRLRTDHVRRHSRLCTS